MLNDQSFNPTSTYDIVSFEQLGPGSLVRFYISHIQHYRHFMANTDDPNQRRLKWKLSQRMTKPSLRPVWPAKTQNSLYIHQVWQGFSSIPLWMKAVWGTCYQRRLWSDSADAQADLSLHWSHKSYCRFCRALDQMSCLKFLASNESNNI